MTKIFIRYLTVIGVGNILGLNLGGLLYLHWAKKFSDPKFRSRTFAPLHWFGLGALSIVGALMLFGLIPKEKFKIKLVFYESNNPHAAWVVVCYVVVYAIVLLGLYLHYKVSSNQSLKGSA